MKMASRAVLSEYFYMVRDEAHRIAINTKGMYAKPDKPGLAAKKLAALYLFEITGVSIIEALRYAEVRKPSKLLQIREQSALSKKVYFKLVKRMGKLII